MSKRKKSMVPIKSSAEKSELVKALQGSNISEINVQIYTGATGSIDDTKENKIEYPNSDNDNEKLANNFSTSSPDIYFDKYQEEKFKNFAKDISKQIKDEMKDVKDKFIEIVDKLKSYIVCKINWFIFGILLLLLSTFIWIRHLIFNWIWFDSFEFKLFIQILSQAFVFFILINIPVKKHWTIWIIISITLFLAIIERGFQFF